MTAQTYEASRQIGNSPANLYYMFTHEQSWREWFCDSAWAQQREEGQLLLTWLRPQNRDLFVLARFAKLEPDKRIELEWEVNLDSARGSVVIDITPTDGGATLTLTHTFPADASDASIARQTGLWENGLENLQNVLKTGIDLRIARLPMLGLIVGALDDAAQARLGLPDQNGTLLADTIEGMGARDAGLITGDVVVALDDTPLTPNFGVFDFMANKKAGDMVKVDYYRGGKRQSVSMTLSPRQMPEVPPTASELAARLREIRDDMEAKIDEVLTGVSDETASMPPADGGWNVKEILAHLILDERDNQNTIAHHLSDDVSVAQLKNQDARVRALVSTHPTLAEMRAELSRAFQETIAYVENFPDAFVSRRSSYWSLSQGLLQAGYHLQDHLAQIREATRHKELTH